MDRFADQFFGRDSGRSSRSRGGDARGFAEQMLHSFASSAYKRAMSMNEPGTTRGGGGGFDADDLRSLGGFVFEMMKGDGNKDERRRRKEKKRRQREKDRERERDIKYDREFETGEPPYVPRYSKGRRRSSQSPLHVKFAEPLEDFDYPPTRKSRRRHHDYEEQDTYERDARRRERRRSRRHRGKIDLQTLKTDLEDMSSTIIGLNERSANHRDCEFYDKFVRKGGQLQEKIGSTLGQIRGWEEEGGDAWYGYDDGYGEDRRERKERKRRRRERGW